MCPSPRVPLFCCSMGLVAGAERRGWGGCGVRCAVCIYRLSGSWPSSRKLALMAALSFCTTALSSAIVLAARTLRMNCLTAHERISERRGVHRGGFAYGSSWHRVARTPGPVNGWSNATGSAWRLVQCACRVVRVDVVVLNGV